MLPCPRQEPVELADRMLSDASKHNGEPGFPTKGYAMWGAFGGVLFDMD